MGGSHTYASAFVSVSKEDSETTEYACMLAQHSTDHLYCSSHHVQQKHYLGSGTGQQVYRAWQSFRKAVTTTTLHPFNGLFSRTTWVNRHKKGKPFWILLEQEMMGWQRHQLDHMQITCTSIETDNDASTLPLSF